MIVKWSYLIEHDDTQPTITEIENHWQFVIAVLQSQEELLHGGLELQTQS